jgi:hypothetical protein
MYSASFWDMEELFPEEEDERARASGGTEAQRRYLSLPLSFYFIYMDGSLVYI